MEEWIIEKLLELLIDLVPNTDQSALLHAYLPMVRREAIHTPIMPPERVELILRRWREFQEFYSGFATRAFELIPVDSDLRVSIGIELDNMREALSQEPEEFTISDDYPLPIIIFDDPDLLPAVLYTLSASLRTPFDVFPLNPSPAFQYAFWFVLFVVRTLYVAYIVDQVAIRVFRAQLEEGGA